MASWSTHQSPSLQRAAPKSEEKVVSRISLRPLLQKRDGSLLVHLEHSTPCLSMDDSTVNPKSGLAVEKPKSYSSTEDLMCSSRWEQNKLVGGIAGRRDSAKEMKRRRRGEQGETENQKQGGQAKRLSEWFEMCPMQSL